MLNLLLQNTLNFYFIPAGKLDGLDDRRVVEEPRVYPHGFCTRPMPGTVSAGTGAVCKAARFPGFFKCFLSITFCSMPSLFSLNSHANLEN
jgi:hypothetical protein